MALGLVSISFRSLRPEAVIDAVAGAGLACIEWGSDVHAPREDPERLWQLALLQQQAGLYCSAYGTYFRLGTDAVAQLPEYIAAARVLGTRVLRLWCGNQNSGQLDAAQWDRLIDQGKQAARIAADAGAVLCLECHNNTATDTLWGALRMMEGVDNAAFRMYWQPNQLRTPQQNLEYARAIAPYTRNIHVFQWAGAEKYPLHTGIDQWKQYLTCFDGSQDLLLEFMPDNRPESLLREAEALRRIAL